MSKPRDKKIAYGIKSMKEALAFEQVEASELIEKKDVTILSGKAGSGKTLLAVYASLKLLQEHKIEKIIITRPTVSGEDLGFLPGGLDEKMDPWVAPVFENLYTVIGKEEADKLIKDQIIKIKPIAYMRGQTFTDASIIVDEAQNVTHSQMEMILGRLGKRSKMIICGDIRQKDLRGYTKSGLPFLLEITKNLNEMAHVELKANHRHGVVDKILDYYQYSDMLEQSNTTTTLSGRVGQTDVSYRIVRPKGDSKATA